MKKDEREWKGKVLTIDEFTLSSLEVLQGFSFFLQMGFTLILATFDGLDVVWLEDVIGEDDCDDDDYDEEMSLLLLPTVIDEDMKNKNNDYAHEFRQKNKKNDYDGGECETDDHIQSVTISHRPKQTWETSKKEDAVWVHSKTIEKREREARLGEVVVKNGDQGYLIPGVHYAPEVTLNILSIEQLERQGFDIIYEDNTCRLSYMFSNPNDHKLNEDKLRVMQNEFLENYFDSLEKGDTTAAGMKTDGMLSMDNDLIEIKGTTYSTKILVTIHLMDLYKLVESFGGYLSVYFARDFGKIGEILGLSIQDGEEVRRCYINFLDVFTSYYKTARVPKQEHNSVLSMPTKNVGKGKEYTCPASHQCDFVEIQAPNMEAANRKGKEKIEEPLDFYLEDARERKQTITPSTYFTNIKKRKQ
ncbi:ARID DNA-binding domain-containing protein [Tanacetum coccineum]